MLENACRFPHRLGNAIGVFGSGLAGLLRCLRRRAVSAINATSRNMHAIASEIFEISKQSFEHATQTVDKLRSAHSIDVVVAIQTNFVKELENAAKHARKFSELMAVFPSEIGIFD